MKLFGFCDQSMREKAWRSRKRDASSAPCLQGLQAAGELAGVTRLRQVRPSRACAFSDDGTSELLVRGDEAVWVLIATVKTTCA